jgi:hypothetical protein
MTAAVVHSALPDALTAAVDAVLREAGVAHVAHIDHDPVAAGEAAAGDPSAMALIGPFRSRDVAETVAATAPAGLPLLAPVATWAGVTRDDEPGCEDDPARHCGTVLRMVARDTEVARRIAADIRARGEHALIVAGAHEYGVQLAGQLRLVGLPATDDPAAADVLVLCGLPGGPEIARAAALAPLPVVAFDGPQGADLGPGREVRLALPVAPAEGVVVGDVLFFVEPARRAARLVADALRAGAADRPQLLAALRSAGPFDAHGDPVDPPVWLWRAAEDWSLMPDRALPG